MSSPPPTDTASTPSQTVDYVVWVGGDVIQLTDDRMILETGALRITVRMNPDSAFYDLSGKPVPSRSDILRTKVCAAAGLSADAKLTANKIFIGGGCGPIP